MDFLYFLPLEIKIKYLIGDVVAKHEFILVNKILNKVEIDDLINDFFNVHSLNLYNCVSINDHIILYILDTLNFVKFKWPSGEVKNELAYYGYSIIEGDEIKKIREIFKGWKIIFNEGNSIITLTGLYTVLGENTEGEYEEIKIEKRKIIKCFDDLINICDIAYKNSYSILHLGV